MVSEADVKDEVFVDSFGVVVMVIFVSEVVWDEDGEDGEGVNVFVVTPGVTVIDAPVFDVGLLANVKVEVSIVGRVTDASPDLLGLD